MAPVLRTYGKGRIEKPNDKDDTFDKLFNKTKTNVFESSSERDSSQKNRSNNSTGNANIPHTSNIEAKLDLQSLSDVSSTSVPKLLGAEEKKCGSLAVPNYLDVSDLEFSPLLPKSGKEKKRNYNKKDKNHKITKPYKWKNKMHWKQSLITNVEQVISSTPKVFPSATHGFIISECKSAEKSSIEPGMSPILTASKFYEPSPKGYSVRFSPKDILNIRTSIKNHKLSTSCTDQELNSFVNISEISQEYFRGFPSMMDDSFNSQKYIVEQIVSNAEDLIDRKSPNESESFLGFPFLTSELLCIDEPLGVVSNIRPINDENITSKKSNSCYPQNISMNESSEKKSYATKPILLETPRFSSKKDLMPLSSSLQNLHVSSPIDDKSLVKSSSYENIKSNKGRGVLSKISKKTVNPVLDISRESSDIEESVVNSADERSCSLRSGHMDEEESAFHSSDEENVSGYSKDKDSIDTGNQKSTSKTDSAIFSAPLKETDIIGSAQSEDPSVDEGDLYTESEIAKSSDSIEVSKTANLENISSDLSSSDRELLKEDDPSTGNTTNITPAAKVKNNVGYSFSRASIQSKDSFYSIDNSASDESEFSFESDSELSCESNRSSRKSSLESTKSLSREVLDHLRESITSLKIKDEYEDALFPRRGIFPLSPLFPLPENQEDPLDDDGEGSICDSATASEEDSHHSASRKSRDNKRETYFRNLDDTGVEGRSSGEDESTKTSPVRETSRLRRSRRLSRKTRESDSRLNMVIEESDSESAEVDVVPQMEHIFLPTGKKYRRSLSIIKHLEEDPPSDVPRGRHYEISVDTVIKLQTKSGCETPRDGRKSLLTKRMSLLNLTSGLCDSKFKPQTPSARMDSRKSIIIKAPSIHVHSSTVKPSRLSFALEKSFASLKSRSSRSSFSVKNDSILREEEDNDESLLENNEESTIMDKSGKSQGLFRFNQTVRTAIINKNDLSLLEKTGETIPDDGLVSDCLPSEAIVMKVCRQTEPITFVEFFDKNWEDGSCKLGEGVFGEVFMVPRESGKNVVKIIPIEGEAIVNGEKQKTYEGICNEILIAHALSELREEKEGYMTPGFVELIKSAIVKGKYPAKLIQFWKEYDEAKGSDNDSPILFADDQLYLLLELGNGGMDLERYSFSTAKQGLSIFKQTVCALAVAEASYEFEHRDLHWGNVLVSRTSERVIPFAYFGECHKIITNGVKATIIDFTLSRMTVAETPFFCDIGADPDMFIGTGDYQFDIYRAMKEDIEDHWNLFAPKTNVRWLHYLVDKMINRVMYQRKSAKVHTDSMKILKDIEKWILTCSSSVEVALKIVTLK